MKEKPVATILQIQRMSTEDGPGIRTTVFFKGCSLACTWCQNPESIIMKPQLQWVGTRCIGCRTCIALCPEGALSLDQEGMTIDRQLCSDCGVCSEKCPSTAMELLGTEWTLDDLVREVEKDRVYFEKSGGGITLSGGEPALQADFALTFLQELRRRGIHTALDTCGHLPRDVLLSLLPHVDLLLYDIKEIEPDRHREFTGSSNERILENLISAVRYIESRETPASLWIRTPVIPDATARAENIRGIGNFIAQRLGGRVERWELCSFNNLCRDKYCRLDMDWRFKDYSLLNGNFMEELAWVARNSGVDPATVCWSGPTRSQGGDHRDNAPRKGLRVIEGSNQG